MIENIKEADVLTFDDNTKYLVLRKIDLYNRSYYFLIGVKNDNLNFNEILYVTSVIDEDGEEYLEQVENRTILNSLTTYVLTDIITDFSPEIRDNLIKALDTNQ